MHLLEILFFFRSSYASALAMAGCGHSPSPPSAASQRARNMPRFHHSTRTYCCRHSSRYQQRMRLCASRFATLPAQVQAWRTGRGRPR